MTFTVTVALDGSDPEYTVRREDGCILIGGGIPITDFVALMKSAPKGSVANTDLARLAQAAFAIGLPEQCEALRLRYVEQERRRLAISYPLLDPAAREWLAAGKQGLSSATIFFHCTGIHPALVRHDPVPAHHPHDVGDFTRCRLLLEAVPAFAERLLEMRTVSPAWALLVDAWGDLCATMEHEVPDWRALDSWDATETQARLQHLLASAASEDKDTSSSGRSA